MLLHLFDIISVTRSFGTHIPDLTVQQSLLRQGDEDLPNGVQKRKRSQAVGEFLINYKTVLLDYSLLLSFILYELIMLIYATTKIIFSL